MLRRGTMTAERGKVLGCGVSPMRSETVERKTLPELVHAGIALHLRDDRGCGDRRHAPVAANVGPLRGLESRHAYRIDEDERRGEPGAAQELEGAAHREKRGRHDADRVDLGRRRGTDRRTHRGRADSGREGFTDLREKHLGIVETGQRHAAVEYDGARVHAPDLVHARDEGMAPSARLLLDGEEAFHPLPLPREARWDLAGVGTHATSRG